MRRLALGALLVATAVAGCGGPAAVPTLPPGRYVSTSRVLTPDVHAFGDVVTARVDAVVDRNHIDPARLRLTTAFAPYKPVGDVSVDRTDFGHFSHVRYQIRLRCLAYACLSKRLATALDPGSGGNRLFRFPPVRLLYDDPHTGKPRQLRRMWFPPLLSVSRIDATTPETTFGFPFTATTIPLPAASGWISAPLLAALLVVAALGLLALPAYLCLRWARARRQPEAEPEPEVSPLERTLQVAEWSAAEGSDERRAALELVAVELDDEDRGGLADDARALAWSTTAPTPDATRRFVTAVREADDVPA